MVVALLQSSLPPILVTLPPLLGGSGVASTFGTSINGSTIELYKNCILSKECQELKQKQTVADQKALSVALSKSHSVQATSNVAVVKVIVPLEQLPFLSSSLVVNDTSSGHLLLFYKSSVFYFFPVNFCLYRSPPPPPPLLLDNR